MSSFNCDVCNKTFKKRFNLRRHINNVHAGVVVEVKNNSSSALKCGLCENGYNNHKSFIEHLPVSHDIKPVSETKEFKKNSEFLEWKKVIEQEEKACYVRNHGTYRVSRDAKLMYYECHRSGVYRTRIKGERKRKVKVQGSAKIGAFCPARIKAVFYNNGNVNVDHFSTHVGHDMEMAHLSLSFEERETLASKIKTNTSFENILEQVKSEDAKKRKHLITKQDLRNIVREFSIDRGCIRNTDSVLSVDAWIEREQECSGKSCVIFHKSRGVNLVEYPDLKNEDFMLVVMSDAQAELLKKYGNNIVCMDSTYRTNIYDYGLITILVLDDLGQGFPCAFFFSNRADCVGLEMFLKSIKNVVGVINARILMTDTSESWYTSWRNVMNECKLIFCTWCVKRVWKKRIDKIKNDTKKKDALKKVFSLHSELDEIAFHTSLSDILKDLFSDADTKDFAVYFENNFSENCENWGHCFRKNLCINADADLHLERIHGVIKHLYLKGKKMKRLDCSLHEIMRFVNTKLIDRPRVLEEVKVTSKLRILKERHKQSLKISTDKVIQVTDDSWSVFSSSADEIYTVKLVESRCTCTLSCDYCKACIHKFTCTCIDACIELNMCKHIHLACRKISECIKEPPAPSPGPSISDDEPTVTVHEEEINVEGEIVIIRYAGRDNIVEPTQESLECMKKQLSEDFHSILKNVSNVRQLQIVNETLEKLKAIIEVCDQVGTSVNLL